MKGTNGRRGGGQRRGSHSERERERARELDESAREKARETLNRGHRRPGGGQAIARASVFRLASRHRKRQRHTIRKYPRRGPERNGGGGREIQKLSTS